MQTREVGQAVALEAGAHRRVRAKAGPGRVGGWRAHTRASIGQRRWLSRRSLVVVATTGKAGEQPPEQGGWR